jgi:hypothetical protein
MLTIIAKYKPWLASAALMTIIIIASAHTAMAQSSVFTYQGRLIDDTLPSTGVYDFQFGLFDALTDGTEVIAAIDRLNVQVTDGAFTVLLDFGFSSFSGQDRFLEIRVRQLGEIDFRRLTPRQLITAAPHALYSASSSYAQSAWTAVTASIAAIADNALQLGGTPADQFVQTNDPRLSPLPASALYIQNSTAQQTSSNFNISGNGVAGGTLTGNIVSATTQYNIGAVRILSIPGTMNSLFGANTNASASNLTNATAIGARAFVSASNSLVLGQIIGVNGGTANTNVGIGTSAPLDRLHVNGIIRVETLGLGGILSLCRNATLQISLCSSSLRYKTAITPFREGLNLVNHLYPISFTWKDGGMRDIGLGAEDVAAAEPLLVTRNDKGEVEGVKYDRITVVLLNAVKEQQELINKQQQQLDALRKLVCQNNPQAEACK